MSYPKRGISVDIGNDKIKVIEYSKNKEKIKVKNALFIDTPEGSVNDGQITDIDKVAEELSIALKEAKIKSRNVIFTISSSKVITREVDLPDLPPKKLETLIKMNAEEYFPVNLVEYTLDYTMVEKLIINGEPNVKMTIIAALSDLLESYVELASVLKLKIAGLDYSGNSIINFAKRINEERTFMLLDLGSDSTMVTIMNEKVVKFNRNLVYGTKVISNSIQNHFGVSYKEAMKIATEQSLLTSTPEGSDYLSSDVSSALNQILNGVSRLVDYYVSRNKDGIDRIILVGGGTNIQGISDYIESYFNIKTKVVENEFELATGLEYFENNKVFFANALGAIYSEINLLPSSIKDKGQDKAATRLRVELGLLVIMLSAVAIYLPYSNIKKLEKERDVLIQEKNEKEVVIPIKEAYSITLDKLSFNKEAVNVSSSVTQVMVKILEEMERDIPSGINYLNMSSSESGMVISCVASEKVDIVHFIQSLKYLEVDGQKVFERVFVPAIASVNDSGDENETVDLESDENYFTFSIACDYYVEVE